MLLNLIIFVYSNINFDSFPIISKPSVNLFAFDFSDKLFINENNSFVLYYVSILREINI